jgi:hypothetical protein
MTTPIRWLPRLILVGGVLFSVYLQSAVPGEVFPNGDAGLKFLLTRQISAGVWHADLRLEGEPWVQAAWDAGLYPIAYPNLVRQGEKRYALYPVAFPFLSALPYRLFGFRGLYLLPLLSTWLLWAGFLRACRGLRLGRLASSAALAVLIFGSPLTYYSATFWEHTPAVALALYGVVLALAQPAGQVRPATVFAGGALLGLSALLREELLLLVGLVGAASAVAWLAHEPWPSKAQTAPLLAGLATGSAVVGVVNLLAYGHPLGIHALTALTSDAWAHGIRGVKALRHLTIELLRYFPLVAFACGSLPLVWRSDRRRSVVRCVPLVLLSLSLVVGTPLLVRSTGGRQWGPRYLLIVVVLMALVAGVMLQRLMRADRRGLRGAGLLGFSALALWGVHVNTPGATTSLFQNYQRRMIPFRFVRDAGPTVVAVSHDSVALQLAALFDEKRFFLTSRAADLRTLAKTLARTGQRRFLYLCYPQYSCGPLQEGPPRLTLFGAGSGRPLVELTSLGWLDRYRAYEAVVPDEGAGR